MARPQRQNADYFSHDANLRNDPKIRAIRTRFGLTGYAVYCMLLEILTGADGFSVQWDEFSQEIYAGDVGVSAAEMQEIVHFCCRIQILALDAEMLSCARLTESLRPLLEKRENLRQKHREKVTSSDVSEAETHVSDAETPHSKEKHSKVKKDTYTDTAHIPQHVGTFNLDDTIATLGLQSIPPEFVRTAWAHYEAKGWLLSEGVHVVNPAAQIQSVWSNPDKRAYFQGESKNGTPRSSPAKAESAYTKRLKLNAGSLHASAEKNSWLRSNPENGADAQ